MTKTLSKILISQLAAGALLCVGCFPEMSVAQGPAPAGAPAAADVSPALKDIKGDHISISVDNLDREIEWYQRVLGFKVTNRMERAPMTNVNMSNGNYRIDLIKYVGSKRTPAEPVYMEQGYVHLALSVPNIPAARAALLAVDPDVKPGNGPAIVLKDPEGNEIEIFAAK